MAICYAKVNSNINTQPIECRNYLTQEGSNYIESDALIFVETTSIVEDNYDNLWIYSPKTKMYYELYQKSTDEKKMTLYPTIYAEVTSDCKAGLALYDTTEFISEEITRFPVGGIMEVTSHFKTDSNGTIWIYVVNINEDKSAVQKGWIVYKNRKNNFANILIHGQIPVLTSSGEIDEDKMERFEEYLMNIRFKRFLYHREFLQIFSSDTKKISVKTGKGKSTRATAKKSDGSSGDTDGSRQSFPYKGREITAAKISAHSPAIAQNSMSFPTSLGKTKSGIYKYDYMMNYDADQVLSDMDNIRQHLNLDVETIDDYYDMVTTKYNRFKLANPNAALSKGFPHVFFTRPNCNIFNSTNLKALTAKVEANAFFNYLFHHKQNVLRQLNQGRGIWNYLLSNQAASFNTSDESIGNDKYGTTYRKNSIAFGRDNNESKAAGNFTIDFKDLHDADVLLLHKAWTDYISNVYLGMWLPYNEYIWRKIIDYACSTYYIITAEDGETIIFWSKYYGCFPVNVPSSVYGWSEGDVLKPGNLSIEYQYSFKEDLNPQALVELNINSDIDSSGGVEYVPVYNENLGTTGYTWVGAPFIETIADSSTGDYYFKLRHKE